MKISLTNACISKGHIRMRLQVGESAPNISLMTMHDVTVQLADVWQPGGVIISFLRHFG